MGLAGAFHAQFLFDRPEPIPDRFSAKRYRCTQCDNEVRIDPTQSLPRCVICKISAWEPLEAAQRPVVVTRVAKR